MCFFHHNKKTTKKRERLYGGRDKLGKRTEEGKNNQLLTKLLILSMKEEKKLKTLITQLGSLEHYSQEMVHFRSVP